MRITPQMDVFRQPPSLDIFVESGGSGKDVTGCALKRMGFTQPQRRAATIAGLDDTTSKA